MMFMLIVKFRFWDNMYILSTVNSEIFGSFIAIFEDWTKIVRLITILGKASYRYMYQISEWKFSLLQDSPIRIVCIYENMAIISEFRI